jgi:hypothetical protein
VHARIRIGAVEGGTGFEFGDRAEERYVGGQVPFCIRTNDNNEIRIPNALQFQSKHSSLACGSNRKPLLLGQIGTPDNMLNFWVRSAIEGMGTGVRDILDYSRVFNATRRK